MWKSGKCTWVLQVRRTAHQPPPPYPRTLTEGAPLPCTLLPRHPPPAPTTCPGLPKEPDSAGLIRNGSVAQCFSLKLAAGLLVFADVKPCSDWIDCTERSGALCIDTTGRHFLCRCCPVINVTASRERLKLPWHVMLCTGSGRGLRSKGAERCADEI